jgi:lysosomal alpha-mannosidase
MLHRRLLKDDGYGVGEALNETAFGVGLVARGRHLLKQHASGQEAARWRRTNTQEGYLRAPVFFIPTDITLNEWVAGYPNKVSHVRPV